jgi:hypothetical protein
MSITRIFLVILFCCTGSLVQAQTDSLSAASADSTWSDTTHVDVRHFDSVAVKRLQADPDLTYQSGPAVMSLWDRFKIWLKNLLEAIFYMAESTNWGNVAVGVIALVIIIYVILRLLKVDAIKMFYSHSDKGAIRMTVIDEDIHVMDFEKLLAEATTRKDYRLAIRLLFLQALKILSDKHLVQWQAGKTNQDYIQELESPDLKPGFRDLNFYFEYAWYGNFNIPEALFQKVNELFSNWRTRT